MKSSKRHTSGTPAPTKKKRKPVDEAKGKRFPIRMRTWAFDAGQRAAKAQNRSLASLMETLLILHLRENGFMPEDVDVELRQLDLRAKSARPVTTSIRAARR